MLLGLLPGDVGLGGGARVRQRLMAIMCRAELAARSPPRLSRCRVVIPDEAGNGAAPQSIAKEGLGGEAFGVVCRQ